MPIMEFRTNINAGNVKSVMRKSELEECFHEYKLQDKVDALKNHFGIRDSCPPLEKDYSHRTGEAKSSDTTGVKDCLRPPVPSSFQTLVQELRDTVRNSYWNKEIGKTIYLPPYLPAGCDPIATTFGKVSDREPYGVPELLNPKDICVDDSEAHKLYRKSHNDYYPSEQIDRKYRPPFDKYSSYGNEKKTVDFLGKKVANCMRWYNCDPVSLVSVKLADFSKRAQSRLGNVKNPDDSLKNLTFGKNVRKREESVAEVFKETSGCSEDVYCSDYAERIAKTCGSSKAMMNNRTAGIPGERTDLPHVVVPDGASRSDKENLGDQTSVMALISPNIFTQLGLSHIEFFQIREYDEMRSIFENIGVKFPGDSFDAIWNEGLKKDCTGGVCVETFRNLLGRLAMKNFMKKMS